MKVSGILLAGMIGLFFLSLGYIIIFMLYQRRMVAKDLQRQKMENDHQKKLLQAVIENQEAERKRIAYDLHDEIGALLSTSRLYFDQLSPGRAEEQLKAVSAKINSLFDHMMTNIRRISHDLRPVVLENMGLVEAIEDVSYKLTEAGVEFFFTHCLTFKMTRESELILYRIFQELVTNTLKHARASRIDFLLEVKGDQLYFDYRDNGVGFSPSNNADGLGLKSIESRLSLLGASMQRENAGEGVRFTAHLNLDNLMKYERH
jgi:signal transduction histidine kinase